MKSLSFEHLRPHWPQLADLAAHAESYAYSDPQSALVKLRCFAELLVGEVYKAYNLHTFANDKFHDRLANASFTSVVDRAIVDKLHAIRQHGNRAAHEGQATANSANWLLKEAHILGSWLGLSTGRLSKEDLQPFVEPPKASAKPDVTAKALKAHQERLDQAIAELEAAQASQQQALEANAKLQQQLEQAQLDAAAKQQAKVRSVLDYNEAETRRKLIDVELFDRGWDINLHGKDTEQVKFEVEVTGQPTATGKGYVDYVMYGDNGKPIAIIEAKRTQESEHKGRKQAELYADALEAQYGQRPVIMYSNGYDIYLLDDAQGYPPRKLYSYYGKDSIEYLIRQRNNKKDLTQVPIDTNIAGRTYQIETLTRVAERYQAKHRKALVVQATGTGKTRVAIGLSKRMIEASWCKRILFLCDRKELRKQAANAYNDFLSEAVYVVGKSKKSDRQNARIYVATYPGMLRIMEQFDPGFFDLIIADESHRSIYNVFGDIFKYFDALQLGLTATPVEMISRSTSKLFGCDYKLPTANYPLEQAIEDGNLVPFRVKAVTTTFLREGIKGNSLTDEQIAELEDQGKDPNELDFDAKEIDKACYNKDTNRFILRNLMENGLRLADGQTLGKSMIFARNIQHAELLAELFSEMYPELGSNFCRVIHSKYERAEELIDDFKLTDGSKQQVTLAISVDMLDTGIDVPSVLNLVFAKPVKSKVKFWQMVGRGTRLCLDLFGPGKHKDQFIIFDHWGNFEYFAMNPDEAEQTASKSISQKLFESRVYFADEALKKAEIDQFEHMITLIKQNIDSLNRHSIAVKENWQAVEQCARLQTLSEFAPSTKATLLEKIAPLMQWTDVRGKTEAIKFDIDVCAAQYAALTNNTDALKACEQNISEKVRRLSMHLNQVREQAMHINTVQQNSFWQAPSYTDLDQVRQGLSPIMHLRDKGGTPLPEPIPVIDIKEDPAGYITTGIKTNLASNDYEIYRREVEKELTPLFSSNPVLQKIRAGEPVTEAELEQLNALVHTKNPAVNLSLLKEFYPDSAVGVDQLLRTMIGLDADAIRNKVEAFMQQHHLSLNANQQRFINMLQNELCKAGRIEVARLYEAPYINLHPDGLDGLFQDAQAELIADFVSQFAVESGDRKSKVETIHE